MPTPRLTLVTLLLATATALSAPARAQQPAAAPMQDTLAAATAGRTAAGCPPMRFSQLQRRVLVEADRSAESLRRYVLRTRTIHLLDLNETTLWVDQVRQRNVDCRTAITAAAP